MWWAMISTAISGQSWWMGRLRITCFPLACAISVISNVWMWVNCNTVYVKWPSSTEDPWTSNLSCSTHLVQCSLSAGTVPGILQWNVSCRHWLIHYCKYRTISEQCFRRVVDSAEEMRDWSPESPICFQLSRWLLASLSSSSYSI